jgi:Cu2+-exporting ATPase
VALALASHSRHPLSLGLVQALSARGVRAAELDDVREEAGARRDRLWNGTRVTLGRPQVAQGMATALTLGSGVIRVILRRPAASDAEAALQGLASLHVEASILSGDRCRRWPQWRGRPD